MAHKKQMVCAEFLHYGISATFSLSIMNVLTQPHDSFKFVFTSNKFH